jgi:HK97 family phage major capsid protein
MSLKSELQRENQDLAERWRSIYEQCDHEGREPTPAERIFIEEQLDRHAANVATIKSLEGRGVSQPNVPRLNSDIGRQLGVPEQFDRRGNPMHAFDPGRMFIESKGFQAIGASQRWTTGAVQVAPGPPRLEMKGTLMESPGFGGGAFVSVPQLVPGVVNVLYQPLSIEQALNSRLADGPTVRYITQGTATSGAGGVAEGGLKPQSTLGLSTVDEPIKKVATVVYESQELFADAPSVSSWINGQLMQFVNVEVERQLFRGTAGGNEVQGLLTGRGVPIYAGGTAVGDKSVQLFKAMNSLRGSAVIEPDFAILNWQDYEGIRLLRDVSGQYYSSGPYGSTYGVASQVSASSQVSGPVDNLWQKPVYVTTALGAGTALVGSRASAEVWNRAGLTIEVTNSGATPDGTDLFSHDLVAIRCERRLGLACYRNHGFVEVRLS